ncbi:MAG: DUF4446 family protein [Thermoleophilia bacterium]
MRDIAPYLAAAAGAAVVVLAVLLTLLWRQLHTLRRAQSVVLGHHGERDLVQHAEHLDERVQNMREAVEVLTSTLDVHKLHLDEALTNRAIVRYDAFRDTGGEQSASLALLDNYRSGLVISTISARDFSRLYVKMLEQGVPDRELSPEEAQVVAQAVPRPLVAAPISEAQRSARLPDRPAAPTAPPTRTEPSMAGSGLTMPAGADTPAAATQPVPPAPPAATTRPASPVRPDPPAQPGPATATPPHAHSLAEFDSWLELDEPVEPRHIAPPPEGRDDRPATAPQPQVSPTKDDTPVAGNNSDSAATLSGD